MQARSAAQQRLPGGEVGAPLEGIVEIEASCYAVAGLPALAALLADAVKGVLPDMPRPLQVGKPPSFVSPSGEDSHFPRKGLKLGVAVSLRVRMHLA